MGTENTSITRKTVAEPRCTNGAKCVAYPTLGEPAKLSRGNPGPRCFACEEQRGTSALKRAAANEQKGTPRQEANQPGWGTNNALEERLGREYAEVERAYVVLEQRRQSVLTCERGLRSAKASGDERLVRRWSRALRDAEARLAWAEADLEQARTASR